VGLVLLPDDPRDLFGVLLGSLGLSCPMQRSRHCATADRVAGLLGDEISDLLMGHPLIDELPKP
jgi:hypothetical protein